MSALRGAARTCCPDLEGGSRKQRTALPPHRPLDNTADALHASEPVHLLPGQQTL
jgi:hypothetical protein